MPARAPLPPLAAPSLWRVYAHGREFSVQRGLMYDNRVRTPDRMVVYQYTRRGELLYRDAAGERRVPAGCGALFVHGEASSYGVADAAAHARYRTLWVGLFGAGLAEQVTELRRDFGSVFDYRGEAEHEHHLAGLIQLADPRRATEPLAMAIAVQRFVMGLFERAAEKRIGTVSPLDSAIERVLRGGSTADSLKTIAAVTGVSREHLTRVFTERFGTAPGAYMAEARLERAQRLLTQTDLTVSEVAAQSGFASAHSLARRLRQAAGCSPTAFRQRQQGANHADSGIASAHRARL